MNVHRVIRWSAPLAVFGLIGAAPAAFAQGQELFEWTGRVDREVQVVMRGNSVRTNLMSQTETRQSRSRVMSALPRQDGQVYVRVLSGRGDVSVVQQPSAQNGYTTVVRIDDPSGGAGAYQLAAYWQGNANGDVYRGRRNQDVYGNDDNNGNNGVRNHGVGRGRGRGNAKHADRDDDDRGDRGDRDDRGGRGDRNRGYDRGGNGNNGGYDSNGRYDNRRAGDYNNGGAYGASEALHWSGNVDGELELRIQNGRVNYRTISGQNPTSIRANVGNTSGTRSGGALTVAQNQGRGTVSIVQQPAQWNGYTTIVRIRDPQGGYGYYDFSLLWR